MASLDLQPYSTGSPLAAAFDPEAVAHPAPTAAAFQALEHARTADRLWREQRRTQLEKQLARGQWLHQWLIRPLITVSVLVLLLPLMRLAHSPAGFGVDLSSDWNLLQWSIRYVGFLVLLFFVPSSIHQLASRGFARWEGRLRQELGQPDDA